MPLPERKGLPDLALDEAISNYNIADLTKRPPDVLLIMLQEVQTALTNSNVVSRGESEDYQQSIYREMNRVFDLPNPNATSSDRFSPTVFGANPGRNRFKPPITPRLSSTSNNTTSNNNNSNNNTTSSGMTSSTTIAIPSSNTTSSTTLPIGQEIGGLAFGMMGRWQEKNLTGARKNMREKHELKLKAESAQYALFVSEFQRGKDLVYGLAMPRGKYVLALDDQYTQKALPDVANLRIQPKNDMDFVIIDTFNNAFLGTEVFRSVATTLTGQKLTQEQVIKSEAYLGKLPGEHPEVKNFREFLEQSYDLESIKASSRPNQMMRYGRACKAGLAYAATARNGKVHFVLDEIDMNKVLEDVKNEKHERNITGKELRWIYRHRNDRKIMESVKFWRGGQPAAAPWDDPTYKPAWAKYDEESKSRKNKK